jgi:hypothetical protein
MKENCNQRNPYALGAALRSGSGPHKSAGRGGARNKQRELIEAYEEELQEEDDDS